MTYGFTVITVNFTVVLTVNFFTVKTVKWIIFQGLTVVTVNFPVTTVSLTVMTVITLS